MAYLRLIELGIGAACRAVLYVTLTVVFCILSANVALRYMAGTSIASASEPSATRHSTRSSPSPNRGPGTSR